MSQTEASAVRRLNSIQTWSLVIGILGLMLTGLSLSFARQQFFQAYLLGYIFWLGIALGCLALVLLHNLSGGMWGALMLRFGEAGMSTLPILALLFIPLLLGIPDLYIWARPDEVARDALLQQQSPYLNVPFFIVRAALYFIVWIICGFVVRRWSLARDHSENPGKYTQRLRRLGAGGLLAFGLTASWAMIDWVMSLEPHWYSTIYAAMVVLGGVLGAFAVIVLFVVLLRTTQPLSEVVSRGLFNDLGSLLLTFVILWTYFAFSQFLIIYSGNGGQEIQWYVHRIAGGWIWVGWAVAILDFFLPFGLLIFRDVKRNAWSLGLVAALLVLAHFVEVYWLIVPSFFPTGLYLNWPFIVAPIAIGGIWIAVFAWNLKAQPIIPQHDRRFIEIAKAEIAREQAEIQARTG